MPAPDPEGVHVERYGYGRFSIFYQSYFWTGRDQHRKARTIAIARRIKTGTWKCLRCHDDLPTHRRADAVYCSEHCRKRMARIRRRWEAAN